MTGYGKAICELDSKKITIEIKSLNSKQLDLSVRIPGLYKEKEMLIRNELSKSFERGKIDFLIYSETTVPTTNTNINKAVVTNYYNQLSNIYEGLGLTPGSELIASILRLPDSIEISREDLNNDEWESVYSYVLLAMEDFENFRLQEGVVLEKDIKARINIIKDLLTDIGVYEVERIGAIRKRITDSLNDVGLANGIDENRFEQELIFYLEKLDITEEKVRLLNHCNYFLETIKNEQSAGKKLGFVGQEIGREINTLGSKANNKDIQRLVIQMKDELEKIKEQLLNVL